MCETEYGNYFLPIALLEALSGLTFTFVVEISGFTWVAKLQIPNFHLASGVA